MGNRFFNFQKELVIALTECIFCKEGTVIQDTQLCKYCGLSQVPRMLVDKEIKKLLEMDVIKIRPILNMEEQLSPFGIDLTLDTKFKRVIKSDNIFIDPIKVPETDDQYYESRELLFGNKDDFYVLHPGEFTLGQSFEFISVPEFIGGGLDGKSSLGRLGITVHTTAASIDQGFSGHLTFELYNAGSLPVIMRPLQSVARLVFHLTSEAEDPYSGEYATQTEVRASRYYNSFFAKKLRRLRADKKIIP